MDTRIFPITMPKWGIEMQQGTVTGWHTTVGQSVRKGEHLLDVETEKIVNSVEAPIDGTLRLILADTGATENVGALIGVFADASVSDTELQSFVRNFKPANASFEPDGSAYSPSSASASSASASASSASASSAASASSPSSSPPTPAASSPPAESGEPSEGEGRVSPIARRIAERLGVDLTKVKGTGRGGRISKEDVEAYAAAQTSAPVRTRLTSMRAAIAKRLLESSQGIPHYRVSVDVACGALLAHAAAVRAAGTRVSINDLMVRATALTLRDQPALNSHLVGEEIVTYPTADICIAVATDTGLITPVVRSADAKSATDIGAEIKALAHKARAGTLTREEILGGTFTISNLGMFGVDRFDAIINPPQVGILAVAAVADRVIVERGAPAVEKVVTLTLSADHRAVDGAVAARFLASLKGLLQSPGSL